MGKALAARRRHGRSAPWILVAASLGLAACSQAGKMNPWGGSDDLAEAPPPAVANTQADARGVITYQTYQVAVARDGDTLDTVASRVGTTAQALASRNALPGDYMLHAGEVLLLPNDVPRPTGGLDTGGVTSQPLGWTPDQASAAIDSAPGAAAAGGAQANPFQNGQKQPLIDPVRHRVEEGETAYSIARLYGVSVTALASWNGLGPDLALRPNQELLIPIVSDANKITTSADTQPGQGTPVTAPPSAATPLPADIAEAVEPESPNLGQYRTPAGGRLAAPVSGKVSRRYDPNNPNGIGFSVPAGTAVHAAAPGEVALVSEALGGLGTIVLVRHKDDLITTYSTLSGVTVKEGDRVTTGEVLGEVAARDKPELQFDVFRGTTSVDPTPYIGSGG